MTSIARSYAGLCVDTCVLFELPSGRVHDMSLNGRIVPHICWRALIRLRRMLIPPATIQLRRTIPRLLLNANRPKISHKPRWCLEISSAHRRRAILGLLRRKCLPTVLAGHPDRAHRSRRPTTPHQLLRRDLAPFRSSTLLDNTLLETLPLPIRRVCWTPLIFRKSSLWPHIHAPSASHRQLTPRSRHADTSSAVIVCSLP